MKRENPNLFGALLLGLLLNTLLSSQTAYWARVGLLAYPLSAGLLISAALLFAWAWRGVEPRRWLRFALGCLLGASSALEVLRFWRLLERVAPDSQNLLEVCLLLLLPVLYLRRVSAIAQTANVVLAALLIAGGLLILSIAGDLQVANLQPVPAHDRQWLQALRGQCLLYPEFLLPALWPDQEKRGPHTVIRLVGYSLAFSVGMHLILELYFGAAMPEQEIPVHAAAQGGALSIFNRLEWLQLLLWAMLVSIKLALYLYAGIRLLGGRNSKTENTAVGLDRFPAYLLGMAFLCMLWRGIDLNRLFALRNLAAWLFAGLVLLMGGVQWLFAKRSSSV